MKIDIISGFLGAGKTTLIQKLIREELNKEKIAIIENEYGEIGIDGNLLRRENLEVREITSGCICCTIVGDFKTAIEDIAKKYNPNRIIIEPSGVAKLSEVISSVRTIDFIKSLKINLQVVVIDIQNFDVYITNFGDFYTNQIANARTIVLSRTQLASERQVTYAAMAITKINPCCSIITTPWDKLTSKRILEVGENRLEDISKEVNLVKKPLNVTHVIRNQTRESNRLASDIFDTWGTETPKMFMKKDLEVILNSLKDEQKYGLIVRAKGIIEIKNEGWVQFDYVPNEIQIKPISSDYTGRLCVIGSKLRKEEIKRLFLG